MPESATRASNHPDLVTVGAYERDNFGDLLFWHVARHYADGHEVIATAPFPGTTESLLGTAVRSYMEVLRAYPSTPVLVVGGEVGGTRLQQAAAARSLSATHNLVSALRADVLPAHASPYLPRHFPHSIALNSVGLDGLRTLNGSRLGYAVNTIRAASYVAVRETASAELLRRLGVPHTLAPDAVHTIRRWYRPRRITGAYILFQMKGVLLERSAIADLASKLLRVAGAGEDIVLMAAGLAPGHDSLDQYERLRDEIVSRSPRAVVRIHSDPDPFIKVSLIAGAQLWVGTSLHGLIVSTSMAVPSVSIRLRKLRLYANTWGLVMPVDVATEQLIDAASAARQPSRIDRTRDIAARLETRAESSVRAAVYSLLEGNSAMVNGKVALGRSRAIATSIAPRLRILR